MYIIIADNGTEYFILLRPVGDRAVPTPLHLIICVCVCAVWLGLTGVYSVIYLKVIFE